MDTPAAAAALAVRHGCELNCGQTYGALLAAVDEGRITEAEIDRAVTRLFAARMALGMFDPEAANPFARIPPEVVNCAAHRALARQAATQSIVMLKNANGILPLRHDLGSVAVGGPCAADFPVLWGNYNGYSGRLTTPLEGIVGAVSAGTNVTYGKGCAAGGDRPVREGEVNRAVRGADVIVAVLGYTPSDRKSVV